MLRCGDAYCLYLPYQAHSHVQRSVRNHRPRKEYAYEKVDINRRYLPFLHLPSFLSLHQISNHINLTFYAQISSASKSLLYRQDNPFHHYSHHASSQDVSSSPRPHNPPPRDHLNDFRSRSSQLKANSRYHSPQSSWHRNRCPRRLYSRSFRLNLVYLDRLD